MTSNFGDAATANSIDSASSNIEKLLNFSIGAYSTYNQAKTQKLSDLKTVATQTPAPAGVRTIDSKTLLIGGAVLLGVVAVVMLARKG